MPPYFSIGSSPNKYYVDVCHDLMQDGEETAPRGLKTRELHPSYAQISSPRNRIVSSYGRVLNLPFALAEVVQILTGQNDAQALKWYNSQIIKIQGDIPEDGSEQEVTRFNAAYGERFRRYNVNQELSFPNNEVSGTIKIEVVDQLEHVINTLTADADSRQANIVLSHPFFDNYRLTTKDRACNVYAHAMIREGQLDWLQVMRSNDVIWGLPYNLVQWPHVMEYVANYLKVPMGTYTLLQDSLHVYEPMYGDCSGVGYFDMYKYIPKENLIPMETDERSLGNIAYLERRVRESGPLPLHRDRKPSYWTEVAAVFNSFWMYKNRKDEAIIKGPKTVLPFTEELRWPLLRFFCANRWMKNEETEDYIEVAIKDMVANGVPSGEAHKYLTGEKA